MGEKRAVVDIGSNAVRLAIGDVNSKQDTVTLIQKLRIPLRFGTDAFELGLFSEITKKEALSVFQEMNKHIQRHKVTRTIAVATSAFRDAKNASELVESVARTTDIKIDIISGEAEAKLVYEAVKQKIDLDQGKALLIDIGGGSTEVIFSQNGKVQSLESFDIGTVRLFRLAQMKLDGGNQAIELINHFKEPIAKYLSSLPLDSDTLFIGTGGNLRRMGKLRKSILRKNSIDHLRYDEFKSIYRSLKLLTPEQIRDHYNLRPDRSEVIVPAMRLVKVFFKESRSSRLEVPDVGLINSLFFL